MKRNKDNRRSSFTAKVVTCWYRFIEHAPLWSCPSRFRLLLNALNAQFDQTGNWFFRINESVGLRNYPVLQAGAIHRVDGEECQAADVPALRDHRRGRRLSCARRSVLQESSDVLVLRTENHGCAAARNFGFKQSSGEYLLFLDSDDMLTPGALEAHVKALSENPAAALSFGAQRIIDEDGNVVRPAHICRPRKDYFLKLLEGNPIGCPGAAMIRRDAFIEAGLFDESLRIVEDYPLYLRLALRHPFVWQSFCVVDYRFHRNSLSQDKERMLRGNF